MKYFIYCRKSSEEDTRQTQSLGTQQRILIDLATKQDLEIVDIIKESKSARSDSNRPLFANMLERVQQGEADAILVVHTDRLARNFIEAGMIMKMIEARTLQEVRTPTQVYKDVPSLMYMGFDFVFASHYSRDLSVKVKAGNKSKLLAGEYPTYAPVGYVNVRPGKGIEPDPIRAPFITRAFELFATGDYSIRNLTELLNKEGFRSRKGNAKSVSSIHRMLTNPEYYGVIRRKGKLYPGNHKPLVSKQLFDDVQDIINGRSKTEKARRQEHKFVYRDFLVCDVCGCKVTAGVAKGKYIYYRCTNAKGECNQHRRYWNKQHVQDEFAEFFEDFTLDPVRAEKSFAVYQKQQQKEADHKGNSHTAIKSQMESLKRRLERLEEMYLDERISDKRYDERRTEYQNELAQLKVLLKQQNKRETETTLELVADLKNQAVQLDYVFKNGDDQVKRDLLKSVLWNSKFKDGKITSTRLTKLWAPLKNLNSTQNLDEWRRGRDSNPRGS